MNRLFIVIIHFLLLFNSSKQSHVRQGITTLKTISKTINTPIIKTIGNTLKNSMGVFRQNKNTIKNFACGFQKKYLRTTHNFGNKSVKYLGEEGIKKIKRTIPQAISQSKQLFRTKNQKKIQTRSAAYITGKELRSMFKRSFEQMQRNKLKSLINMVSKSKPQLPLLFVTGGLSKLTEFSLIRDSENLGIRYENFAEIEMTCDALDYGLKKPLDTPIVRPKVPKKLKKHVTKEVKDRTNMKSKAEQSGLYNKFADYKVVDAIYNDKGKFCLTIPFTNKMYYSGEIIKGHLEGPGELTMADGETFKGNFEHSMYTGEGVLTNNRGQTYVGNFVLDEMCGIGKRTDANGDLFIGMFVKEKLNGRATAWYKNGDIYTGDWKDDEITGKGVFKHANGDVYNGYLHEGVRQGKGKLTSPKGDTYEGGFSNGQFSGYGEYVWSSGNHYKGYWKDDLFDGVGEQYRNITGLSARRNWVKGKPV